jgi:hypothetical protein
LSDPAYLLLIAGKQVVMLEHAVVVGKFFWNCLNNIPMLGNFPILNALISESCDRPRPPNFLRQ